MTISFGTRDDLLHHTNSTGQWFDFERQPLSDLLRFLLEHITVFEDPGPDGMHLEELPAEHPEFAYDYSQLCMQNFYRMYTFHAWSKNYMEMVARGGSGDVMASTLHIAPTAPLSAPVQKKKENEGKSKKTRVRPNPMID